MFWSTGRGTADGAGEGWPICSKQRGTKSTRPRSPEVADRSHLLSKSITLDTHILDVANLMEWEDLQNVVLCGHSYGGWPISGVAEKQEKRIGTIVYLDAFLPNNGQRVLDTNSPDRKKSVLEGIEKGELARPGPSAAAFFVNDKDQALGECENDPSADRRLDAAHRSYGCARSNRKEGLRARAKVSAARL